MADFIYGELNDAVLSIDYEGKRTDTADVSVDPSRRTVSVDVRKVPCALSMHTQSGLVAYDGSRPVSLSVGAYEIREVGSTGNFRNYGLFQSGSEGALGVTIGVPSAKTLLSAEILQCQVADEPVHGYKVGEYYARLTCASRDSETQENYYVYMLLSPILKEAKASAEGLVDSERERAEKAEQALSKAISDEASAREAEAKAREEADDLLQEGIDEAQENIASEATAREEKDDALQAASDANAKAIAAEATARENGDSALSSRIDAEVARAMGAETSLSTNLGTETAERKSADAGLKGEIAKEASARQEADSSLEGKTRHISAGDTYTDFDGIVTFKGNVNVDGYLSNPGISQLIASGVEERAAREAADKSINASLATKQDALVSGTNIKTINGQSLLGEGDLSVPGGASDSYSKGESDARYAPKTAEVLSNGAVTSIGYDQIEPYSFVIMHGYKNNVGAPNQLTFVLVPKWLTDGESNLIVPGMATETNWNYGIVFTRKGDTVSWETDVDYGGDRQFLITNILGVH